MLMLNLTDNQKSFGGVLASDPLEPTIFHETWWLNAVARDGFDEVRYYDNGKLVGRFPYTIEQISFGRTLCRQPWFAHYLGPAVDEGNGAACNRRLRRDQIIKELLVRLPRTSGFSHSMHSGVSDLLIFQEQGYRNSVQFTFEIDPNPTEETWLNMRDKTRNAIRGAEKQLNVDDVDVGEFVDLYQKNLGESGYHTIYDTKDLIRVCDTAVENRRGRLIAARQKSGQIDAAIMYIWDAKNAYYYLSTRTESSHNGAVSLLIWTAIKESQRMGLMFDFHGVSTYGGRLFYTGFGGRVAPRYTVYRFDRTYRIIDLFEKTLRSGTKTKYLF